MDGVMFSPAAKGAPAQSGPGCLGRPVPAASLPSSLQTDWHRLREDLQATLHIQLSRTEELLACSYNKGLLQRGSDQAGDWVRSEYYYNVVTRQSQWEVPAAFKDGIASQGSDCVAVHQVAVDLCEAQTPKTPGFDDSPCDAKVEANRVNETHVFARLKELDETCEAEDFSHLNAGEATLLSWFTFLEHVKEPPMDDCLTRFVSGSLFVNLTSLVIVLNSAFMLNTTDHNIANLDASPRDFVAYVERAFVAFFTVELLLKLAAHRIYFFFNDECRWNMLDLGLVAVSLYGEIGGLLVSDTTSLGNVTFLRTLRVIKIVRTFRLLRVLTWASELRRMLNSLLGSVLSLVWSMLLMLLIFFLFGIAFVQGLTGYLDEVGDRIEPEAKDDMMRYFGSVSRAMLTCYMMTTGGDDWSKFYDIIQPAGPMVIILFLLYILFSQVALMNIRTGIFVENALKLAQPEYQDLALENRREKVKEAMELRALFESFDADRSGTISWDEFCRHLESPLVRSQLEVLGLEIKDAQLFFHMLCQIQQSEVLSIDFFVDSCLKMKGQATGIDLQMLAFETRLLRSDVAILRQTVGDLEEIAGSGSAAAAVVRLAAKGGAGRRKGRQGAAVDTPKTLTPGGGASPMAYGASDRGLTLPNLDME